MLRLLLNCHGVHVDSPDADGATAMHFATRRGHMKVLDLLAVMW